MNAIKRMFWWFVRPVWPYLRDMVMGLGIVHHHGRSPFHLGWLAPGKSLQDLRAYLRQEGFRQDNIAWIDDGEVLDLRLRENFQHQFHLRVFDDGEIRGHYELTPEYKPIAHVKEKETSEQREKFLVFLGDWITTREND